MWLQDIFRFHKRLALKEELPSKQAYHHSILLVIKDISGSDFIVCLVDTCSVFVCLRCWICSLFGSSFALVSRLLVQLVLSYLVYYIVSVFVC